MKKKKEESNDFVKLPPIPTLAYLRDWDSRIMSVRLDINEIDVASGPIVLCIFIKGKWEKNNKPYLHLFYEKTTDPQTWGMVDAWVPAKEVYLDAFGRMAYRKRADWPYWLRKF
jgi:hypothetical protein